MNYNKYLNFGQSNFNENNNNIFLPSSLVGFTNDHTSIEFDSNNRALFSFYGSLTINPDELICPSCFNKMHINNYFNVSLKHLPFGYSFSFCSFKKAQFFCPKCHISKMQSIPFKSKNHNITIELYNYISDLLALGLTNKLISSLSGVNKNIIKDIDMERLANLYTADGLGKTLKKPESTSSFLAIDEFKLHNGYKFATHIIDLDSGHILWIAEGKKKDVVYDFINFVGLDWMSHVKAISCDMNSDFEEAFKELCPHIKPVYDFFHIIKNFNDKVINEVRKDEIHRLTILGLTDELKLLKHCKYILLSSRVSLKNKDIKNNVPPKNNSSLFKQHYSYTPRTDHEDRYNKILSSNKLFFLADYIKEDLKIAYSLDDENLMLQKINDIISLCLSTSNSHFIWFAKLLSKHIDGIISHSSFKISSGKIEGLNNKIKTIRRQAYGYPDDEYFFLKLIDASRH